MAQPAAPKKEQVSNNESFSRYLAEGTQDLKVPSRRDLLKARHTWSLVRNELERELEIEGLVFIWHCSAEFS
ncbi:hypothetical protein QR685DRAFT_565135 [Neurospora intermedia]|uniref:Uncharacterized protein n=1 Tax=Neurospora intermedia TaxID=5142 RepID=A0ABR3D756_NEUIN